MIWTLLAPSYGRPRGPLLYIEGRGKKGLLIGWEPPWLYWPSSQCLVVEIVVSFKGTLCKNFGLHTPTSLLFLWFDDSLWSEWRFSRLLANLPVCRMPLVPNETESNSQIKLCLLLFSTTLWKWSLPVPILYFVNKSTCISEILGRWCK